MKGRQGFEPTTDIAEKRILLLDDVFTTGARSQSAATALQAAGAQVPVIVAIARRFNPDWRPEAQTWWDRQLDIPFSWSAQP